MWTASKYSVYFDFFGWKARVNRAVVHFDRQQLFCLSLYFIGGSAQF